MSSIHDIDADISPDECDDDYVPDNGVASSSSGGDNSCDENEMVEQKPKCKKSKRSHKRMDPEPENKSELTAVDEKMRAESLWSAFLSDVKPPVMKSTISKIKDGSNCDFVKLPTNSEEASVEKLFEFAGETFRITNDCSSPILVSHKETDSIELPEEISKTVANSLIPKKRSGLASVLDALSSKKKKLSTMEKTLFDWNLFKKNQDIELDLASYNRGKNGYIERQRFLNRSDVRSFEAEKAARLSKQKL